MRIRINPDQLKLLSDGFTIVEGQRLIENKNLMLEGRTPEYLVGIWISSYPAEIRVGTNMGSGGAMAICRKLFPNARIISAKKA